MVCDVTEVLIGLNMFFLSCALATEVSIQQLLERFEEINANYREYQWAWTYQMVCDYYDIDEITLEDANRIHEDYIKARRQWIAEIRKDAEKEFAMGDVEEEVFRNFVDSLDQEVEYED